MNIYKLVYILLISLCVEIQGQNNDSIIYWHKEIKLNWDDFKGLPPDSSGFQVAWSFVQIYTNADWKERLPNYRVYVVFKKNKSWSKDTSLTTLAHEQLHFDIGELYARKMRKAMLDLRNKKNDNINDYLNALNKYYTECYHLNDLYDKETAHGVYTGKQFEWNKKIIKELCAFREYEVDYLEYLKE
jgi:hypothetical protein